MRVCSNWACHSDCCWWVFLSILLLQSHDTAPSRTFPTTTYSLSMHNHPPSTVSLGYTTNPKHILPFHVQDATDIVLRITCKPPRPVTLHWLPLQVPPLIQNHEEYLDNDTNTDEWDYTPLMYINRMWCPSSSGWWRSQPLTVIQLIWQRSDGLLLQHQ